MSSACRTLETTGYIKHFGIEGAERDELAAGSAPSGGRYVALGSATKA
jgi:hypothetical protein